VLRVCEFAILSEIRGSSSGVAEEYSVLGYGAIPLGERFLMIGKLNRLYLQGHAVNLYNKGL